MGKRFLAAAVGVPLILVIVFFSTSLPILIDIAAAIICVMSAGEFAYATKTLKLLPLSIPSLLFAAAYPMLISYELGTLPTAFMLGMVYSGVMMAMMIFFHKTISFPQFAYSYSMTLIITAALSTMVMMKNRDPSHSSFYFILAMALPWMADIGAFFAGSFLGKHKLCPNISPKKTIEGAVGGVLLCVGATCLIGWIFADLVFRKSVRVDYLTIGLLAFTGSFLSIVGDLTFSVIKRHFEIKDYGFIIPGHGGFLDRFDSVVIVAPYILLYTSYFPILLTNGSV